MLRACVLSLLMLFTVAATLPFSSEVFESSGLSTEASRRRSSWRSRHNRRARLRRQQRMRRLRALARQRHRRNNSSSHRRATASRARWRRQQRLAARMRQGDTTTAQNARANLQNTGAAFRARSAGASFSRQSSLSVTLPQRWTGASSAMAQGETRWSVRAPGGRQVGVATLRPFAATAAIPSAPNGVAANHYGRSQAIGGVPATTLRRAVIERMITEGGWVTNDFVRQIGGRRVFVVTAQTGSPADRATPANSWAFYFTEVDGSLYSLTTAGLIEFSELLANESAQMLASLRGTESTAVLSPNRPE